MVLTEEQRRRIEENRARAQARLREKRKMQTPPVSAEEDRKLAAELGPGGDRSQELPGPPPAKAGRLTGDISGCRSTRAGGAGGGSHGGKSSSSSSSNTSGATTAAALAECEGCAGAEGDERVDKELLEGFGVTVCRTCKLNNPDFQCVTKKEAKDAYLLADGTIAVLKFIERDNPHHPSWTKMKLYLRRDVAEYSLKRWGGEDGVAAERRRRDSGKFDRSLARTKGMFKRSRGQTEDDGVAGGFV